MGNTYKTVMIYVAILGIDTVLEAIKSVQPYKKISKLLRTAKTQSSLSSLQLGNYCFTFLNSPNLLLLHSVPVHIHKLREKNLAPRQIQL